MFLWLIYAQKCRFIVLKEKLDFFIEMRCMISFFGEKEIWLSRPNLGDIVTLGLKSNLFTYEII